MADYLSVYNAIHDYVQKHVLKPTNLKESDVRKLAIRVGVSTALAYYIFRYIIYRLYLCPTSKIPGPKVGWFPFMGNFIELSKSQCGKCQMAWAKEYGDVYVFRGPWNKPRVTVTNPELVKRVLMTEDENYAKPPEASAMLRRVTGNGLLVSEGDVHRQHRKMLNPAFSVSSVRAMVPFMFGPAYRLRDLWIKKTKESNAKVGSDLDMVEIQVSLGLEKAALDIIGWSFGQDFKALEEDEKKNSAIAKAYLHVLSPDWNFMRIASFVFPWLRALPTKSNRLFRSNMQALYEESKKLIEIGVERDGKKNTTDAPKKDVKDLLATMVGLIDEETGEGFTVEELRQQCLTFLAAGHETSSNSMSWCLWSLADNQEIQDKLRAEVSTLFVNGDEVLTYEQIEALPLLNNVVRETLRVTPVVPFTSRITLKSVTLGSHFIPKGTVIQLAPMISHLSPEVWGDDADKFNPYRWETLDTPNEYQYMPFLAGRRKCIGYRFALIEFKILLAVIIKNLQFFRKPGFEVSKVQQITMKPLPNMTLLVKAI